MRLGGDSGGPLGTWLGPVLISARSIDRSLHLLSLLPGLCKSPSSRGLSIPGIYLRWPRVLGISSPKRRESPRHPQASSSPLPAPLGSPNQCFQRPRLVNITTTRLCIGPSPASGNFTPARPAWSPIGVFRPRPTAHHPIPAALTALGHAPFEAGHALSGLPVPPVVLGQAPSVLAPPLPWSPLVALGHALL